MARPIKHQAASPAVVEKIKVAKLLNRMQDNALGLINPPLTPSQVRCIEVLLKKVIPDLATIQHKGTGKNGEIVHKIEWEIVRSASQGG